MTTERIPEPRVAGAWVSEIAEKLRDELEATLKEVMEQGFLTLGRAKPAERWRFYMDEGHTLIEDVPLLLDRDYLQKRKAGQSPRLVAETLMDQYALEVQAAVQAGMQPPPEPRFAYPWPVALGEGTAEIVFTLLQREFIALYNAQVRKLEREQPETVGVY